MECPFCSAPVMFRPDGTCPACGKNSHLATDKDRESTVLEFDTKQTLPETCFVCGGRSEKNETFKYKYIPHGADAFPDRQALLFVMVAPIVALFWPLFKRRMKKASEVTYKLTMPVCMRCVEAAGKMEPLNVIEGVEYKMRVHRKFREDFEKLHPFRS